MVLGTINPAQLVLDERPSQIDRANGEESTSTDKDTCSTKSIGTRPRTKWNCNVLKSRGHPQQAVVS